MTNNNSETISCQLVHVHDDMYDLNYFKSGFFNPYNLYFNYLLVLIV